MDKEVLSGLTEEFLRYFAKKNNLEDKQIPQVNFIMDDMYAKDPFGKTAYYNPQTSKIFVYIPGRHYKDILRSVAHECIHHLQNLRGDLNNPGKMGKKYAQENRKMREMEKEAYLEGNMTFRDWTDTRESDALTESLSLDNDLLISERNHKMYYKLVNKWI
tara:strand:+ start:263 stop:745 length:483 start_codon:yes stop_codon:yes gene_type:complete